MFNIFRDFIDREASVSQLLEDASAVGDREDVIRLGIHAAKLGLSESDLEKMALVYHRIKWVGNLSANERFKMQAVFEAIRIANDD